MALVVRCKDCEGVFSSEYQMRDTSELHKPNYSITIEMKCPDCGKTNIYSKDDHFFQ